MEAVTGDFTEDGRPRVPIRINGIAMRATIDTGFNGELALPVDLAERLGLTPITLIPVELADGSWRLMSISDGRIRIGDMEFLVEIIIGASEPSIGMGLLRHFKVVLDARAGLVRLEPHGRTS